MSIKNEKFGRETDMYRETLHEDAQRGVYRIAELVGGIYLESKECMKLPSARRWVQKGFFPGSFRRAVVLSTQYFQISTFQKSETIKFCLYTTQFLALCYSSPRNRIYCPNLRMAEIFSQALMSWIYLYPVSKAM